MNENMKWNSHIKYLSSKPSISYYMINSLRGITSQYILRNMYFAQSHVHLKYGLTLWGNDPESKRIFKLQKKIITIISNVGRNASCRNLFRDLNILPLPCLYMSEVICYTKSNIEKMNFMLYSPCILTLIFSSSTNECTFLFLYFCSIHPTYVSAMTWPSSRYIDKFTSLFTGPFGIITEPWYTV
jgi:hypothetical protein